MVFMIKMGISFLIVTFNYILRTVILKLVEWMGRKTFSKQMNSIMIYVFFSQFINTAFILLAVYSNFEKAHVPYVKHIFNGQYPDFTMEWYFKVGAIFSQTLLILGISPLFDLTYYVLIQKIKLFKDTGYFFSPATGTHVKTKAKTIT